MTKENQMLYLEIHNSADGMDVFKAGTRYDFYCIQKIKKYSTTLVKDENGACTVLDLSDWKFLPNYNYENIKPLLGTGCEILFSRGNYGTDYKHVTEFQTDEFKYPLVHSTPKSGNRYMYSSRCDRGFFGIPKVIFGETGIYDVVVDVDGIYGMTQGSMAIKIQTFDDVDILRTYLMSNNFLKILESCSWSNFSIDWRLFTNFKKDFYRL